MRSWFVLVVCLVVVSTGVGYAELGDSVPQSQSVLTPDGNANVAAAVCGTQPLDQQSFEPATAGESAGAFEAGLGSNPIFIDPCTKCATDNCTGTGGNDWFNCVDEHCANECHIQQ
jgi:hypothetical protein